MAVQVKELTDVEVLERSLVGKPANRRKFICFKSEEGEPPVAEEQQWDEGAQEHLDDGLNTPVDGEDDIIEKAASAKGKNSIRGALRLLNSVRDEIPEEIFKALAAAAGFSYEAPPKKKDASDEPPEERSKHKEPTPAAKPEVASSDKGDGKDGEPIPDMVMAVAKGADTPERGTAILAAYRAAPDLISGLMAPMLLQKEAKIGELQDSIKPLLKERDDRAVAEIVDQLDLPGDRDKHVAFIQALTPEQRQDYLEAHKSTSQVAKSAMTELTRAQGTDAEAPPAEDSAWAEVTRRAKAQISKSDEPISLNDAMAQVFRDDPDLYEKYTFETMGMRE